MPHRKNILKHVVIATLISVVVLAAVAIVGISVYRANLMKAAYGANYAQRPYTATAPQLNVGPTKQFTFDLSKNIDFGEVTVAGKVRPKDDTTLGDVAQVFSDPGLQHQVPAKVRQSNSSTDQVVVAPASGGIYAADYSSGATVNMRPNGSTTRSSVELGAPDTWSGFTRYYLARYIGADGRKLKRPVVTMFTVKGADFALKAPATVHTSVSASGLLQVSWTPVKGATAYQLVLEEGVIDHQDYSGGTLADGFTPVAQNPGALERRLQFSVLDREGGTSLNVTDPSLLDGTYITSEDQVAQNRSFVEGTDGVNLYGLDVASFSTKGNGNISLAIVATNGNKRSPMEFTSIASLLNQIPVGKADYAQQLLDAKAPGSASGTSQAMTMADGSTRLVTGSSGHLTRYAYPQGSIDWNTYKSPAPKTTMASVPYPVNGSGDLVKFLASNLMADNYYLDVTRYLNESGAPDLDDALEEAVAQNPYILYDNLSAEEVDQNGRTVIYITSFYQIKDRVALRQQLWAKVQAVDSQIIKAGMSNEAKAQAINTWIMAHGVYDDGAVNASTKYEKNNTWDVDTAAAYYSHYAYAQNATGILLYGKGVCASYAMAYKALADRAALPCVYVTGTVKSDGEGHAWNKVDLGGRWLIVDSAWNDEAGSATRYFGLTDNSKLADRTQDTSFMVDKDISLYAN